MGRMATRRRRFRGSGFGRRRHPGGDIPRVVPVGIEPGHGQVVRAWTAAFVRRLAVAAGLAMLVALSSAWPSAAPARPVQLAGNPSGGGSPMSPTESPSPTKASPVTSPPDEDEEEEEEEVVGPKKQKEYTPPPAPEPEASETETTASPDTTQRTRRLVPPAGESTPFVPQGGGQGPTGPAPAKSEPFVPALPPPPPAAACPSTPAQPASAGGPAITIELFFTQADGSCPTASAQAAPPANPSEPVPAASKKGGGFSRETAMTVVGVIAILGGGWMAWAGFKVAGLVVAAAGAASIATAKDKAPERIGADNAVTRGTRSALGEGSGGFLDQIKNTQDQQKEAGVEHVQQGHKDAQVFDAQGELKGEGDVGR